MGDVVPATTGASDTNRALLCVGKTGRRKCATTNGHARQVPEFLYRGTQDCSAKLNSLFVLRSLPLCHTPMLPGLFLKLAAGLHINRVALMLASQYSAPRQIERHDSLPP